MRALRILATLLAPTAGRASVNGFDVQQAPARVGNATAQQQLDQAIDTTTTVVDPSFKETQPRHRYRQ